MAERPATGARPMTWVLWGLLALAALAAPIITFKAFTDADTPDPVRQQRLREVQDGTDEAPNRARGATTDPSGGPRP